MDLRVDQAALGRRREPLINARTYTGEEIFRISGIFGFDVPEIVSQLTADPRTRGSALTVTAAQVRERIRLNHAVIVVHVGAFVGFVSMGQLTPDGLHCEVSTLIVAPEFRGHNVPDVQLYPALARLADESGITLWGTTHHPHLIPRGQKIGLEPVPFDRAPPEVRAPLCFNAPCFVSGGPNGGCKNERVWGVRENADAPHHPDDCWVRMREPRARRV